MLHVCASSQVLCCHHLAAQGSHASRLCILSAFLLPPPRRPGLSCSCLCILSGSLLPPPCRPGLKHCIFLCTRETLLQDMIRRFVEDSSLWVGAVEAVAELDALTSLASHALNAEGAVCRPRFVPQQPGQPAVFEARALRHPSGELLLLFVHVYVRMCVGVRLCVLQYSCSELLLFMAVCAPRSTPPVSCHGWCVPACIDVAVAVGMGVCTHRTRGAGGMFLCVASPLSLACCCGHASVPVLVCAPAGLPGHLGAFVPNDVSLGGSSSPAFIVLTGPNMGGCPAWLHCWSRLRSASLCGAALLPAALSLSWFSSSVLVVCAAACSRGSRRMLTGTFSLGVRREFSTES
jgi:hypothetical protein